MGGNEPQDYEPNDRVLSELEPEAPVTSDRAPSPARSSEFTQHLGIQSIGMVDGAFVLELQLDSRHMSAAARAHGGVLFTLLDTALGRSVIAELPPGRGCATVEIKINYFRPVQEGRLRATGRCVQRLRSLAYAEGEVRNEADKILARATGTFFLTDTMRQPDRERV